MQEVMEHYGMALLSVLEVVGVFIIVLECMKPEGFIYDLAVDYMRSICG